MLSRRDFLKIAGLGAGAAFLHGCAPGLPVTPSSAAQLPAPAPASTAFHTATPRIVSPTPEATETALPFRTPGATAAYADRKLCFVLWDHQLERYGFRSRNLQDPVPMTCPLYSGAANPVTPAWQAYWKGILRLCNPEVDDVKFEHAWKSLTASDRAFTNGTGSETSDFKIHSLTCGGATHEMVTGEPDGQYMEIYTLNWDDGPPPIPARPEELDMTRHFFATTGSNVKLPDGSYAVYGFPQFENCIVPLISQGRSDRILLSRIKVVDSLQRPYNP
ncbi:MAG: twin-arginine translocation signal domain-containing protein [Anaerolineae bacterium]